MTLGIVNSRSQIEAVLRLVQERTGLVFASGHQERAEVAIRRTMQHTGAPDPAALLSLIERDPDAFSELVTQLTVGETYFFREPAQFDFIRNTVIPELSERRQGPLRAWSAGCASGEEAYSLNIMFHELGQAAEVIGTDLSAHRLRYAERALYSRWSLRGLQPAQLRSWFHVQGNRWSLRPEFRTSVRFSTLNLVEDAYPSLASGIHDLDLILCRNVLIYLDADAIARVAQRLLASLNEGGWLFLGASDPLLTQLVPCEVVLTGAGLAYRKVARRPPRNVSRPVPPSVPPVRAEPRPPQPPPRRRKPRRPTSEPPAHPASLPAPGDAQSPAGLYSAREYARAAEIAQQQIEQGESTAEAWVVLVRSLANQGQLAEAGRACSTALDRHRTSAELMYLHAVLLAQAGRDREAAQAARRALFLDRNLAVGHLTLGTLLARLGDRPAAVRSLRNAERLLAPLSPQEVVPASDGQPSARLLDLVRTQLRILTDER